MKCLSPEILESYRTGNLRAPLEMRQADQHLASCRACRALLHAESVGAAPRLARALLPETEDADCPDDEEMIRYLDGATDETERERMAAHLEDCALCRDDLDDLRRFQEQMQAYNWRETRSPRPRERFLDDFFVGWQAVRARARLLWTKWSGLSLWRRLLAALLLGLTAGGLLRQKAALLLPLSSGVVNLLGAVAAPLIFFAILRAVLRTEVQWQAFRKLIVLLALNTLTAIGFGLVVANLLRPGMGAALGAAPPAPVLLPPGPASLLAPLVENNLLHSIVLALALGLALREARKEERQAGTTAYRAAEDLIETAYRCLMRLLQWVISLLPLAVFASAANITGAYGRQTFQEPGSFVPFDSRLLTALVEFALSVLFALGLQTAYYLLRLRFHTRHAPRRVLRETRSVLLMALSTASSAAALPLAYARVKDRLGVSEEAASLGILAGGNVNHDGTALFEAMGVLLIAQGLGIPLGPTQQALLVVMAALASVCVPGIPEAGLVMMALIFKSLNLPQAIPCIVLLLPFDWMLDRCRTMVNALGHITTACLLDEKSPALAPLTVEKDESGANRE